MKKLTMADITPAVEDAVGAYLLARAHAETMRERVDKVYTAVLNEIPLFADQSFGEEGYVPSGERITGHGDLYLTANDEGCSRVYAEVDRRLRGEGLKPASMPKEHCPALVAERVQTETEWAILDAAAEMLDVGFDGEELNNRLLCLGLEKREEFLDLVIKLVVNRPGFKPPKLPLPAVA